MHRLGIISDTHGLLRPEAAEFLRGCDHIVHGGDIGTTEVLTQLCAIAPLTVVRGNVDTGSWAQSLPETEFFKFGGKRIFVIHNLALTDVDPVVEDVHVVVSGHSHKPSVVDRGGVLYVNPGSAGPRRFALPVSIGELLVDGDELSARTIELQISSRS